MRPYLDLLRHVLEHGSEKADRTGTGTRSVFGWQMRFDLNARLPAGHHQEAAPALDRARAAVVPAGRHQHRATCKDHKVGIWDEWADAHGELGPVYGKQWRRWAGADGIEIDQIRWVVDEIRRNPDSRRLIVSAWNVADLPRMALMPCHTMFQFYVADGKLSCQLYQRSGDIFLGVPFNIASYALLTHMVAQVCGLGVGDFVHTLGDAHLYSNHFEQAREQLSRAAARAADVAAQPGRRATSSVSSTTTSRSRATTRCPRSRRRWRSDDGAGADRGAGPRARHRPRQRSCRGACPTTSSASRR